MTIFENLKLGSKKISGLLVQRVNTAKAILYICLLGLLSFSFFVFHQTQHNHSPRIPWSAPKDQVWSGRWFNYVINKLNYNADIPVLLPLEGVLILALTGMVIYKIFDNKKGFSVHGIIGIMFFVSSPFFLSYFYYTYQTPLFAIANLLAVFACWLCVKKSIAAKIAAPFLLMLALASYQPSISVFAVLALCICIWQILTIEKDQNVVVKLGTSAVMFSMVFISGAVLYRISLSILSINPSSRTEFGGVENIIFRFNSIISKSFEHLLISQPDMLAGYKVFTLSIFVLSAGVILFYTFRRNHKHRLILPIVTLALLGLAVVATKTMFFISPIGGYFQYRYNPGIPVLFTCIFLMPAIFLSTSADRNGGNLLTVLCIFISVGVTLVTVRQIQANLVRQNVLYRGETHDLMMTNRILHEIETHVDFDQETYYDFVRIGRFGRFRENLLSSMGHSYDTLGDDHMDTGEAMTAKWADEHAFVFLGSRIKFKRVGFDPNAAKKREYAIKNLLDDRKPWPHPSSIVINEGTIYIYLE